MLGCFGQFMGLQNNQTFIEDIVDYSWVSEQGIDCADNTKLVN